VGAVRGPDLPVDVVGQSAGGGAADGVVRLGDLNAVVVVAEACGARGVGADVVAEDRVVVGGALSDGGGLYRWLTRSLLVDELTSIESQLSKLEADAHGLTILPFWSGERSTGWYPDARGAIFGLTQRTTTIEIIRAALEAIAYRFALISRALESVAPGATIVATGNALRGSRLWAQILADALGRKLVIGGSAEASARGAALLALEAVGKIGSIEDLSVVEEQVFEPDMSLHQRYALGLARQEELYSRVMGE